MHPLLGTQPAGTYFSPSKSRSPDRDRAGGGPFGTGSASLLAEVPVLGLNGGSLSAIAGPPMDRSVCC